MNNAPIASSSGPLSGAVEPQLEEAITPIDRQRCDESAWTIASAETLDKLASEYLETVGGMGVASVADCGSPSEWKRTAGSLADAASHHEK